METRTTLILSIILLVTFMNYVHLQENNNGDNRCLTSYKHGNCSCCKSGFRGHACDVSCEHCLSRLGTEQSCDQYCETGYYGKICDKPCPKACASSITGPHLCKEKLGLPSCVECITGFYGTQCDLMCDANCLNRTCYQTDGSCLDCRSNEFYGKHCSLPCSHGCVSGTCNKNGNCTHGCKFGFYGERCESLCGSNCQQGKCTSHEYHGYSCTEGCHGGYWGTSCLEKCPKHCIECEREGSRCTSCEKNYVQKPETEECLEERKPDVASLVISVIMVIVVVILAISIVVYWTKCRHRHRNPSYTYRKVKRIANNVLKGVTCKPTVGIIFGFGFDRLANGLEAEKIVKYKDIKGFPVSKMRGHENRLVFGKLGGKNVVVIPGLSHSLEDYPLEKITLPVRMMESMGVETLFAINAAGSLNTDYNVGDMMIIKDHLNLSRVPKVHPLHGILDDRAGPRFRTMHGTYNKDLRQLAKSVAEEMDIANFHEGVYSMICFPSFETATDCKFLQSIGVDAIGMSHIPEVIEARQCNMKVFGLTLITNKCIMEDGTEDIDINKNIEDAVKSHGGRLQDFVTNMIQKLED